MEKAYCVYVQINEQGYVVAVNSDAFISDLTGWLKIDEGNTDRYHHAQNHYFEKPIVNDEGVCHYKIANGVVREATEQELTKQKTEKEESGAAKPSIDDRVLQLEEALDMILSGVTE